MRKSPGFEFETAALAFDNPWTTYTSVFSPIETSMDNLAMINLFKFYGVSERY